MTRVAISLDEHALGELRRRAQSNVEPVARLAARLVRDGLLSEQAAARGSAPRSPEHRPAAEPQPPPWIEPATRPQRWRRRLWASVVSLQARYPQALGRLPADWWTDRALTEMLAALAAWRAELDAGDRSDPRTELLFHDRLELLQRRLLLSTDPTEKLFAGGAPPAEWIV